MVSSYRRSSNGTTSSAIPWMMLVRITLLSVPMMFLFVLGLRNQGTVRQVYLIGAGAQLFLCFLGLLTRVFGRQPLASTILLLYGIGVAWIFLGPSNSDWVHHLAQAVLLVVPIGFLGAQSLLDLNVASLHRAKTLARRIAKRKDWPRKLDECRHVPEIKALRDALVMDASPALELLKHSRAQVRMAGLLALEFRKHWRKNQAEIVLQVALRAEQPELRAAALSALANVEDRYVIEALSEFLRDPAPQVRKAAMESLLWSTEARWSWIRHAVRRCLADRLCQKDGPLRHHGPLFSQMAIDDLTAWASESGLIGVRAAQSLAEHYSRALQESPELEIIEEIQAMVRNPRATAILRQELAQVLVQHNALEHDLLQQILQSGAPAPLRLLAAEKLLESGEEEAALSTLSELARLPNREIALATAEVVQRLLRIDLGLLAGQPLPQVQSRQAAEVSRRVMTWASEQAQEKAERPSQSVKSARNSEASGHVIL